jgi:cell pole-organizing protein PopZ
MGKRVQVEVAEERGRGPKSKKGRPSPHDVVKVSLVVQTASKDEVLANVAAAVAAAAKQQSQYDADAGRRAKQVRPVSAPACAEAGLEALVQALALDSNANAAGGDDVESYADAPALDEG